MKPSPSVHRDTEDRFDAELDIDALVAYDHAKSFNISKEVEGLIKYDFDLEMFSGLDARLGFRSAKNILEWLTSPQFCGSDGFKPWPKQIFVLASIFEEICPMSSCTDRRFFEDMLDVSLDQIYERVSFLEHGVCPNCGARKADLYQEGLVHLIDDVSLCLGQRSSKTSMVAGFAGTYIYHRMLTIPDVSRHYNLKPGQKLYGTFVAQTKEQAIAYPWSDFINMYHSSAWFKDYNKSLSAIADEEGWDVKPFKIRDTFVEYRHKNLYVGCHGPNKRTLRGATRFFAATDEFGWFSQDNDRVSASASETEDALNNALLTLRAATRRNVEHGWNVPINILNAKTSSPSHVGDPILTSIQRGKGMAKSFVLHAATWEFTPTISREDLDDEFARRPEHAMRSFGAVPPLSNSPFHERGGDSVNFFGKLSKGYSQLFACNIEEFRDKSNITYLYPNPGKFSADDGIPRVLSVDPGHSNNSFGISVVSLSPDGDPIVDFTCAVKPRATSSGSILRVNFQKTLDALLIPVINHYNILAVVYDRWQSLSHIHQLRDHELFANRVTAIRKAYPHIVEGKKKVPMIGGAVQQSLKFADFQNFDTRLDTLSVPSFEKPFSAVRGDLEKALKNAPVLNLVFQIATVRVSGAKVTKPAQDDDDLYRSMVNGVVYMCDPIREEVFKDHKGKLKREGSKSRGTVFVASLASKGGGRSGQRGGKGGRKIVVKSSS